MEKVHLFEDRGLGKAPFRYVGMFEIPSKALAEQNPTAYNNAMAGMPPGFGIGTCAYCGMPLTYNYLIISADGRKHAVGCECIRKVGDAGLIEVADKEKRALDRRKRQDRAERKRAAAIEKARIEREAQEAAERERNGGLTDAEVAERRLLKWRQKRVAILGPIIDVLSEQGGGFCQSVSEDMSKGKLVYGRGIEITCDIYGKAHGRRGSKAYEEAYADAEDILERAGEVRL